MAITTQTVKVDLNTGKVLPVVYAHQNDTNRAFAFEMYNNGVEYSMTGATVKFGYKSPVKKGAYFVITGTSMASGSVSGNTVTLNVPKSYLEVSGDAILTMIIFNSSASIRPINIKMVVQSSADGDDVVMGASDWPVGLYDYMDNWLAENEPTEIANIKSEMANSDLFNVLSFLSYNKPLYPTNGVQFTYIDIAKYSIVGTSTNAIAFDFFNSMTDMPDGIETNKTYKIYVDGVNNLEVRIFFSTNGTSWDVQQTAITSSGVYNVNVPSNATGMLFRIYIASGKTVDTVLSASMYSQTSRTVDLVTNVINESINGVYPNKIDTIGDIRITASGWTFSSGSGTRARTNANNTYHLYEGDVIKNTNPSLVRMYIGYRGSTGNYYYAGWLQEDFTIPFECDCVILLSYVTESVISTADELAQYVYVVDSDHAVAEISKDNTELTAVVKSVNHQGYNHLAPNQSLPAYRLSKKYGFTMVECDVLKTSDGVYVLGHDNDISKTGTFYNITGGTPTLVNTETLISNLTYQQLVSTYDVRKSLNDKYAGTKIARFDDFILLCKHLGLHAYVELKTGGTADTQALHDIVKSYGMLKNVTWISSLINYLNQMKVYDGSVRLGYVVQNVTAETIAEAQTVQTENNEVFMDANYSNLTTESVDLCADAGLELEAWIVNTSTAMTSLNPYVTRVTTDRLKYSEVFEST